MSHQYYNPVRTRLQRSELAVPGSSPKMFEKALNSNADYVFLDLEDAVSPNDKLSITILYYSKSYATSPSKGLGSNQVDFGGIVNS